MTLTMTQLMSAINLRLWSQNHKWLKYCFFRRLVPAAGNCCPQRGQSCDNFSQSKSACPWFWLYWQLLKDVSIPFLPLAPAPAWTSGWNCSERKILPNVIFKKIIIFRGLLWLSVLANSPVIQEAVLAHQKVQDHCLLWFMLFSNPSWKSGGRPQGLERSQVLAMQNKN